MSQTKAQLEQAERDRRRFFRINDRIALKLRVLADEDVADALARFESNRSRRSLVNILAHETEKQLPQLRVLENQHPGIAAYLSFLEKKIDMLAQLVATQDEDMPNQPTHAVNLSAQGVRFYWPQHVEIGSTVELRLQLFPSRMCLLLFGTVIRCQENKGDVRERRYAIAVDYSHIEEEDREVVVKHIHGLQLNQIRRQREC